MRADEDEQHYFDPTQITASLPLLPFDNQVGGHGSFFRFSKQAICKAVSKKEQSFYEHLERQLPELLPFIPQYFGIVNVTYSADSVPHIVFEKNKHLLSDWRACHHRRSSRRHSVSAAREQILRDMFTPQAIQERLRQVNSEFRRPSSFPERRRHGLLLETEDQDDPLSAPVAAVSCSPTSLSSPPPPPPPPPSSSSKPNSAITSRLDQQQQEKDDDQDVFMMDEDMTLTTTGDDWKTREKPSNPWSMQVYQRDQQKMKHDDHKEYIMIEDLTDGIHFPCVLDLKMGTRQHSVYASPAKAASQTRKCQQSTSAALGVRVCGMQVYKQGDFIFQDKYQGRRLSPIEFRDTLVQFLNNNGCVQIHHIPAVLHKLRRLATIIRSLNDYRFYGSSLLMIYDGDETSDKVMDVRIIDFAHSVTAQDPRSEFSYPPQHPNQPDDGYLLGLKTLTICFEWIYKTHGGEASVLNTLDKDEHDVFEGIESRADMCGV